jgi:hypothetical protein
MKKPRRAPLLRKKKRHDAITKDFSKTKEKHLEKLATKMLEDQEKMNKLREKNIDDGFLDLF